MARTQFAWLPFKWHKDLPTPFLCNVNGDAGQQPWTSVSWPKCCLSPMRQHLAGPVSLPSIGCLLVALRWCSWAVWASLWLLTSVSLGQQLTLYRGVSSLGVRHWWGATFRVRSKTISSCRRLRLASDLFVCLRHFGGRQQLASGHGQQTICVSACRRLARHLFAPSSHSFVCLRETQ